MTHICVSKLVIIGSDNGLPPGRRQAITWIHVGILLIGPLRTNFSEISIEIQIFSINETNLKMSSAKWHPFYIGLNVLAPYVEPCHCIHYNIRRYHMHGNCIPINTKCFVHAYSTDVVPALSFYYCFMWHAGQKTSSMAVLWANTWNSISMNVRISTSITCMFTHKSYMYMIEHSSCSIIFMSIWCIIRPLW